MSEQPSSKELVCAVCAEPWKLGHRCKPTTIPGLPEVDPYADQFAKMILALTGAELEEEDDYLEVANLELQRLIAEKQSPAHEPCKQPDAIQEIYAHAKAITNLTAAWPMEGASPPPTDALSEVVELLDQGKDFATKWNMRNSIVEALALINSHAAAAKADAEQYREWVEPQLQRLGRVTAQPPAATHTQWERDRLATYLAKHKPALRDHACAQCVPGGEIVVEDFECCYHMALRIVGTSETKEAAPPNDDRDTTIKSLCDRIERINQYCYVASLTHQERLMLIERLSGGFMEPPPPAPGTSETKDATPPAARPSKEVLQAWIRDASNHIESGVATDMIAVCPVALRQMCLDALARATRDAARYRWLREKRAVSPVIAPGFPWPVHVVTEYGMPTIVPCIGTELDRFVDDALSVTKSACCRQSPCLHPGVGPCDMLAVEKPACNCEGPQKIGPGYHAPYCATMAGTEFAKKRAPPETNESLWTCDECAGPPRPYSEIERCPLKGCKPVRAQSEKPVETPTTLCPNCEKDEVGTFTADDWFLYGVEKQFGLVAESVLFFRCMACGLEFTGEDGERKRLQAVREHLERVAMSEFHRE